MSTTRYERVGRVRQKQRTRAALLDAAQELLAEGTTPTVELAAERAAISRATAYRYFPSQASLMAAAYPEVGMTSALPEDAPTDPAERVDLVVAHVTARVREREAQQRTMLRLSLAEDRPGRDDLLLRQGRVIGWLEDALEPLRADLGDPAIRALAVAIRSTIGIEAYVWLTDVAGLAPDDAVASMRWTALAQLAAARTGSPPPAPVTSPVPPRTGA